MVSTRVATRVLLSLLLTLTLSACSSVQESLYNLAISYETSKAGLENTSVEIEEGRIALLRSEANSEDLEPLVLIHGFGVNKTGWLRLSQQLWDDFHIIAPDLPGHGDSVQDMDLSYRVPEQAERLDAILDRLDVERAHIAGNSMGGAIALTFAARYPDRVMSLNLLNTAGIHRHPSEMDRLIEEGDNPLLVENTEDYHRLIDFAMEKPPFVPWPLSAVMARRFAANYQINQKIFHDIRRDTGSDVPVLLRGIEAPSLVLWGSEDRLIDVKNAPIVADALPNARLEVLEGIGHAPMIEAPQRTAELIRATAVEAR